MKWQASFVCENFIGNVLHRVRQSEESNFLVSAPLTSNNCCAENCVRARFGRSRSSAWSEIERISL